MYPRANRNSFANGEVEGLQVVSVKFVKLLGNRMVGFSVGKVEACGGSVSGSVMASIHICVYPCGHSIPEYMYDFVCIHLHMWYICGYEGS